MTDKDMQKKSPSSATKLFTRVTADGLVCPVQARVTRECKQPRSEQPNCPIKSAAGEHPFEPVGLS